MTKKKKLLIGLLLTAAIVAAFIAMYMYSIHGNVAITVNGEYVKPEKVICMFGDEEEKCHISNKKDRTVIKQSGYSYGRFKNYVTVKLGDEDVVVEYQFFKNNWQDSVYYDINIDFNEENGTWNATVKYTLGAHEEISEYKDVIKNPIVLFQGP